MSAENAVQQVIADLRYHWPSQVEICVAADLLETQQAMLAEKDETIAELREEIDRCHARLEIDHVFTGGGKQEDGGFLRVEVPMGERKSLPDAVACRDDTIELQGEQIAELRARCEAAERDAERLRQFERWADEPIVEVVPSADAMSELEGRPMTAAQHAAQRSDSECNHEWGPMPVGNGQRCGNCGDMRDGDIDA